MINVAGRPLLALLLYLTFSFFPPNHERLRVKLNKTFSNLKTWFLRDQIVLLFSYF